VRIQLSPSPVGGSLAPGADVPSAESLVGWLLEHQDLQVTELSDSEEVELDDDEGSLSDIFSDSDSISDYSDDFADDTQVTVSHLVISLLV
jgi:hypothetical protein